MIRDLSKYARRVALGAMTALALVAGSVLSNQAHAQSSDCSGQIGVFNNAVPPVQIGVAAAACGSENPSWHYQAALGGITFKWLEAGYNMVDDCMTRAAGQPGRNLGGVGQTPVWYFSSDETKAKRKAEDAAYAASPAARVTCDKATVASRAELQSDRFAQFGIDPAKAAFTAKVIDVAAERRNALVAEYQATIQPVAMFAALR